MKAASSSTAASSCCRSSRPGSGPDSIRTELSLQGLTQVQAYDGKEGWQIDPFDGRKDPERMPADDVKEMLEDASIDGPLVDASPRAHGSNTSAPRTSTAPPAHKLKVTRQDGGVQYVYLDPDYFLEIRIESQRMVRGVKRISVTDLGNYEKVGGVYWPFSIESGLKGAGDPAKFEYESAQANVAIAPRLFLVPGRREVREARHEDSHDASPCSPSRWRRRRPAWPPQPPSLQPRRPSTLPRSPASAAATSARPR